MRRSLLVCTAMLLLVAAKKPMPEKAKSDKALFQGTWTLRKGSEKNGRPLPPDLLTSLRITFAGDRIIIKNRDDTKEGTFTIDPMSKPKAITISHSDGKTRPSRGIYTFERGLLQMLFAEPGKKRPTGFRTEDKKVEFLSMQRVDS